jgi:hypothetical protein
LQNPSFESPGAPSGPCVLYFNSGTTFDNWTATGPSGFNIAIVNSCLHMVYHSTDPITYTAADGIQSLDLTGGEDSGVAKGVMQTVSLPAGIYQISFAVGNFSGPCCGSPYASSIKLLLNGIELGDFVNSENTPGVVNWKTFTTTFSVSGGPTTVELLGNTTPGSDNYTGLDNVQLNAAIESDVPEPGTLGGMVSGTVLLLILRKRRSYATGSAPARLDSSDQLLCRLPDKMGENYRVPKTVARSSRAAVSIATIQTS